MEHITGVGACMEQTINIHKSCNWNKEIMVNETSNVVEHSLQIGILGQFTYRKCKFQRPVEMSSYMLWRTGDNYKND